MAFAQTAFAIDYMRRQPLPTRRKRRRIDKDQEENKLSSSLSIEVGQLAREETFHQKLSEKHFIITEDVLTTKEECNHEAPEKDLTIKEALIVSQIDGKGVNRKTNSQANSSSQTKSQTYSSSNQTVDGNEYPNYTVYNVHTEANDTKGVKAATAIAAITVNKEKGIKTSEQFALLHQRYEPASKKKEIQAASETQIETVEHNDERPAKENKNINTGSSKHQKEEELTSEGEPIIKEEQEIKLESSIDWKHTKHRFDKHVTKNESSSYSLKHQADEQEDNKVESRYIVEHQSEEKKNGKETFTQTEIPQYTIKEEIIELTVNKGLYATSTPTKEDELARSGFGYSLFEEDLIQTMDSETEMSRLWSSTLEKPILQDTTNVLKLQKKGFTKWKKYASNRKEIKVENEEKKIITESIQSSHEETEWVLVNASVEEVEEFKEVIRRHSLKEASIEQ